MYRDGVYITGLLTVQLHVKTFNQGWKPASVGVVIIQVPCHILSVVQYARIAKRNKGCRRVPVEVSQKMKQGR